MSARGETGPFRTVYASALGDYLLDPSEASLRVAYELGREAVGGQLSVLDLAIAHQEALLSALGRADLASVSQLTRAAGDFFLESLASFEMVQRGFKEAREAFLLERRQTELSRRLSTFLTDVSLALDASDSLPEMLRLVAEQARELVGAECCLATLSLEGGPRTAEAASCAEPDTRWTSFVRWLDLAGIYQRVRVNGGSVRIAGHELAGLPLFRISNPDRPLRGWLAASLTALDGSELGAIQLFDKQDGNFTRDDEAALVHLAQMASAAVERTRLYERRAMPQEGLEPPVQ
jgi:Phosphoserine phosphatase RsbU, N-terminal domain/GAF domain